MKAFILNSGYGSRMGEFTHTNHKSMATLSNGETILGRQIRILSEYGIEEFVITTGHCAQQIAAVTTQKEFSHLKFTMVHNEKYLTTNYIYSMYLARDYLDDEFLLLHGDLVFNRKLIASIVRQPHSNFALYHPTLALPQKDFKAQLKNGAIHRIGVEVSGSDAVAFQPLYRLSKDFMAGWSGAIVQDIDAGHVTIYAEEPLNRMLTAYRLRGMSYEKDFVSEVDTLEDLEAVREQIRLFDFAEQEILTGKESISQLEGLLKKFKVTRPMVVTGGSFKRLCLRDDILKLPYPLTFFHGYSPNPTYDELLDGVALFRDNKCDAIISIGGGSAMDIAKCIKLFAPPSVCATPVNQSFIYSSVPHIAIPTTAGTGSESTRFSVITFEGMKQSVRHDSTVPEATLLVPELLESLPDYQKKCTLLDALCQCIEAVWAVGACPQAESYAKAGIVAIVENWEKFLQNDSAALCAVMQASNNGGRAINLTTTTAPHAMSYVLTTHYGLPHGYAVALCLPLIWRYLVNHSHEAKNPAALTLALAVLRECFATATDQQAIEKFEQMVQSMQLPKPHLKEECDLDDCLAWVNQPRLQNTPIVLSTEVLRAMYTTILST